MSDVNISIGVTGELSGAKRIKRGLDDINRSANKATNATNKLDNQIRKTSQGIKIFSRALGVIAGSVIANSLTRISDEFTVLDTSIKNSTGSVSEYDRVFNSLFQTAQRNGAEFSSLAETYQKLNVALDDNVKNSVDLTKVTEILSRGFAASGTSAQTAAGASLQLTQGLATDFQAAGQELNSIIEGAPLLAKAIAVELGGKGAVDLKRFAQEGKLTAETFLKAMIAAEDQIKAFKIPPTINRSVQRLKNSFVVLVGQSEMMRGAAAGIAGTFDFMEDHLEGFIKVVGIATGAVLPLLIRQLGIMIPTAINAITVAIAANPVGAIISAFSAATVAIFLFRKELAKALDNIHLFGKSALDIFKDIGSGAKIIFGGVSTIIGGTFMGIVEVLRKAFAEIEIMYFRLTDKISRTRLGKKLGVETYTPTIGALRRSQQSIGDAFDTGFMTFQKSVEKNLFGQKQEQVGLSDIPVQEIGKINDALNNVNNSLNNANAKLPEMESGFKEVNKAVDRFADSAGDAFGQIVTGAASARGAISDLLRSTAQEIASTGFSNLIKGILAPSTKSSGGASSLFGGFLGGIGSLFGFDSGGDIILGGRGGVDNNIISLNGMPIAKTSRGETLSIKPSGQSGGQGGVIVNQTINISTGVQETVQAELVAFLPVIEQTTKAAIQQDKMRGVTT